MLFKNCTIKEFDNFQIWTCSNTEFIRGEKNWFSFVQKSQEEVKKKKNTVVSLFCGEHVFL